MKTETHYICEICGGDYKKRESALKCEARGEPVPKYTIGQIVTIITGDGAGEKAKITRIFYYEPGWAGEKYAHRVGYNADLINSWGSRQLIEGESV